MMIEWVKVTKCPKCGGELVLSEFYTYSMDFKITKKGVLSKRGTRSDAGPIDCMNAYCENCRTCWDATQVVVEGDGCVYLRDAETSVFTRY